MSNILSKLRGEKMQLGYNRGRVIGIQLVVFLSISIISTNVAGAMSSGNGQKIVENPIIPAASNNYSYSIVHISDPQFLSAYYPSTLNRAFSTMESIKNKYNISAIFVTGDMVHDGGSGTQWENYLKARSFTSIPVFEIAGNHEVAYGISNYSNYDKYIGINKRNYTTIVNDFLFIGIGWNGDVPLNNSDILSYKAIIASNPEKIPVFAIHYYFSGNTYSSRISRLGISIKDNLVLKPTFIMSGHIAGSIIHSGLYNNTTYVEDLTNYQDQSKYLAGKLYTVYESNGKISKITERNLNIYPKTSVGQEIAVLPAT